MKKKTHKSNTVDFYPFPPDYRIYCVTAETVQTNLDRVEVRNPANKMLVHKLVRTEQTKHVVQPSGRMSAQAMHASGLMRDAILRRFIIQNLLSSDKAAIKARVSVLTAGYQSITTISLVARDSFELNHVKELMIASGIPVHAFEDERQMDYGSLDTKVVTAVITEPTHPDSVVGILDYLPMWS